MTKFQITNTLELSRALREIGLSPQYASMLAHKRRTPSLKLAVFLEREMGIPCTWWIAEDDDAHQG